MRLQRLHQPAEHVWDWHTITPHTELHDRIIDLCATLMKDDDTDIAYVSIVTRTDGEHSALVYYRGLRW